MIIDVLFKALWEDKQAHSLELLFGSDIPSIDPSVFEVALVSPVPTLTFEVGYDVSVSRPFGASVVAPWHVAEPVSLQTFAPWKPPVSLKVQKGAPWESGTHTPVQAKLPWAQLQKFPQQKKIPHEAGTPLPEAVVLPHEVMTRLPKQGLALVYERAQAALRATQLVYEEMTRIKNRLSFKHQEASPVIASTKAPYKRSTRMGRDWIIPWENAKRPATGRTPDPVQPPLPPIQPYIADLIFDCQCQPMPAHALELIFSNNPCPGGLKVIPIREVYFVLNEVTVVRADDDTPIEVHRLSIQSDRDSFAWTLSMDVPASEFDKVAPDGSGPVEIEVTINGVLWVFQVEDFERTRSFGRSAYKVSGKSVTALLEDPYAPVRSIILEESLTAQQIAAAELERPGLATGFSLDWQLPGLEWTVPAGAWSYQGLTPMQVITAIAGAVGGYVNSHPSSRILRVLPQYPYLPWDIAEGTPDLVLPESYISTEGLKWEQKPDYNGVIVSGQRYGKIATVKKTGSAADFLAPMVTGPLLTTEAALREMGRSILGNTGKMSSLALKTWMGEMIGAVVPGTMIEVNNGGLGSAPAWRGIIRSCAIEASATEAGEVTVYQNLGVYRPY